jgi:hypothetical protein
MTGFIRNSLVLSLTVLLVACGTVNEGGLESTVLTYPPNSNLTKTVMPSVTMPAYRQVVIDPVFQTRITRVSDKNVFAATFPDGNFENFFRNQSNRLAHSYSKNQPWNSDGSLMMLNWSYPAPILDGRTYQLLRWIHQPSQAVWSQLEPDKTYGTYSGTNQLVSANMTRDWDSTVIHTFSEYDTVDFGSGEGNLSHNDQYIALFGFKNGNTDILVYDLQLQKVTARRSLGTSKVCNCNDVGSVNNITMSQSGKYVLMQYNPYGRGITQGVWVLDPKNNLANLRNVSSRGGNHFDVCYDTAGNEVYVGPDANTRAIYMRRLDTGVRTTLLGDSRMGWPIHVSCRNTKRPGWSYISSFDADYAAPDRAYYQTLFAVRLESTASGNATVQRFAHEHHSVSLTEIYERSAMGVPNPQGNKVLWASDWGDSSGPIYAYVTQMPSQ